MNASLSNPIARAMAIAENAKAVVVGGEKIGKIAEFIASKGIVPAVIRTSGRLALLGAMAAASVGILAGGADIAHHYFPAQFATDSAPTDTYTPDPRDPMLGSSPLSFPAYAGQIDMVNRLIAAGSDLHQFDAVPLRSAAMGDQPEVLKRLLAVDHYTHKELGLALTEAAESGSVACVSILLKSGADPFFDNQSALKDAEAFAPTEDEMNAGNGKPNPYPVIAAAIRHSQSLITQSTNGASHLGATHEDAPTIPPGMHP